MGVFWNRDPNAQSPRPVAFSHPRPLTAAATQIRLQDKSEAEVFKSRKSSAAAQWQAEAWEYYDAISEIKYAFNLVSNVVSRIRLYTAVVEDPAEAPVPIKAAESVDADLADAAERALARLDSAYGGQAGLLRDAALNLSVAGECYLVQVPERVGTGLPESWDIRSIDELSVNARGTYSVVGRRELQGSTGSAALKPGVIELPENAFVGRLWRAHPRFSEEPDSSMRGVLDLCAQLLLLDRTFKATARSRLNAGMLYMPDGLSSTLGDVEDFDDPAATGDPSIAEPEDEFEEQLMDAMTTPIQDESSAAAVVPLLVRGPAELGDKIKQFSFQRTFDDSLNQRADRVLERILQGIDVPKDTVTGLANVKYANAIQIDESLYKAHIEPMLLLIADAFTVVFLRPYLKSIGYSQAEVNRIVVWYDPSSVATRNDRAADADSGYEKMAISTDTWRRAHGFSDQDAPTPNEIALRLLLEKGSLTPELSESLLNVVAPEIMKAARAAGQAASVAPVPPEVNQILGMPGGAPTDPAAAPAGASPAPVPTDALAPPEANPLDAAPAPDASAPAPDVGPAPTPATAAPNTPPPPAPISTTLDQATPGAPVDAGQDAPPFPLVEPR